MDFEIVDGEIFYWNIPDQTSKNYNFETRITALKSKTQNKIIQTLQQQKQKAITQLQNFYKRNETQIIIEQNRLKKVDQKMKKVNYIEQTKMQEKNSQKQFKIDNHVQLFKIKAKQEQKIQIQKEIEQQIYHDQQIKKLAIQAQQQQQKLDLIKQSQMDKKNQIIKQMNDKQKQEKLNIKLQKKNYAQDYQKNEQQFKELNLRSNTLNLISNYPKKIIRGNETKSFCTKNTISQADLPYFKNLI